MSIKHVLNNDLDSHIKKGIVLVDFYADWCGPCKMIAPILEELEKEYKGKVSIVKVNVDQNPQVASMYGIMSIPSLLLFKNGQQMEKTLGFKPKAALKGWIDKQL